MQLCWKVRPKGDVLVRRPVSDNGLVWRLKSDNGFESLQVGSFSSAILPCGDTAKKHDQKPSTFTVDFPGSKNCEQSSFYPLYIYYPVSDIVIAAQKQPMTNEEKAAAS